MRDVAGVIERNWGDLRESSVRRKWSIEEPHTEESDCS